MGYESRLLVQASTTNFLFSCYVLNKMITLLCQKSSLLKNQLKKKEENESETSCSFTNNITKCGQFQSSSLGHKFTFRVPWI